MKESILILIICVVVKKVTAPTPFNLPSTNLPYPKSTTPPAPKLPKWNDYNSKNSAKPMKDNGYLASLVKRLPKDNKIIIETKKAEGNKSNVDEKEYLNTTNVLFAEEILSPPNALAGNESKEIKTTEIKKRVDPKLSIGKVTVQNSDPKGSSAEPKKGVKLLELLKPLSIKPKTNNTENQNKTIEIPPTMIPIFRPNNNVVKSQITKEDLAIITSVPKSVVQDLPSSVETPEKVLPTNEAKPTLKSDINIIPFNIPCHKASDVLDEVPVKPEILRASHAQLNPIPKAMNPVLQEPNQVEKPEKLETDESVAIIFKPKNISLLNVYGDLLKKITLTVLVPYHISKLGT